MKKRPTAKGPPLITTRKSDTRREVLRFVLAVSIAILGFVVWQAIHFSTAKTPEPTPPQAKITQHHTEASTQSFQSIDDQLQQQTSKTQQSIQQLQQQTANAHARTKATIWWLATVGLIIHIAAVTRILLKLRRIPQPVSIR